MSEPTVIALMLVNGRPEMTRRAVASFHAQTYKTSILIVFDSGLPRVPITLGRHTVWHVGSVEDDCSRLSIGRLRNIALSHCAGDIICHMDSDDLSHPRRIEEQVALLQSSGRPCVGYNDVLFLKEANGEAWRYHLPNPYQPVGASLCYWRATWEAKPFEDINKGEDTRWLGCMDALAVSSLAPYEEPRLICSLHGDNTSSRIPESAIGKEWNRAARWDSYCERTMELK